MYLNHLVQTESSNCKHHYALLAFREFPGDLRRLPGVGANATDFVVRVVVVLVQKLINGTSRSKATYLHSSYCGCPIQPEDRSQELVRDMRCQSPRMSRDS